MSAGHLGQMVTPNSGNRLVAGATWALDNGCFGDRWSEDKWAAKLEKLAPEVGCLFAVVPDVVGDAEKTNERWVRYAPFVKSLGYRAAYVTQNGCVAVPLDADAVFTGGDDYWKLGYEAQVLAAEGRRRGLWTHMGRVNSLKRLRFAAAHGYDSVDGTFLAFGPDINLPKLLKYMELVESELTLPPWAA